MNNRENKEINNEKEILAIIINSINSGHKIIFCGNGGSASMCNHMTGELMKDFIIKRQNLKRSMSEKFDKNLNYVIPAISLCSNSALITAIANDMGYEYIFGQQLFGYGSSGDILFIISTSGESKNCIFAAKIAKKMNIIVISLTKKGSTLEQFSDFKILFSQCNSAKQQEKHLIVLHDLCEQLEYALFN